MTAVTRSSGGGAGAAIARPPHRRMAKTTRNIVQLARAVPGLLVIRQMIANSNSAMPNVQTIVAPVGRSAWNEIMIPIALTTAPIDQPMARRLPIDFANSIAATDGTIRYENTSSTPAIATDDVTTKPNDV